ncbi:MAG: ubiquinol-cytochrome c reductase iron-sulfur subunit [bacterium]
MSHTILPKDSMPRRSFFKFAIGLFNGLIALLLLVPGLGYLLTPIFRKSGATWVKLGAVENFFKSEPQKAIFKYTSETGYTRSEKTGFVWVVTSAEESHRVMVLSAVCTHTGCNVSWQSSEEKFVCPCHGGQYNINGEVIAGPPPRPLEKIPIRIKNEQVFVQLPT